MLTSALICVEDDEDDGATADPGAGFAELSRGHVLGPLSDHFKPTMGGKQKQLACRVCSRPASYYCRRCGIRLPLCGPGTGRTCESRHRSDPAAHAPSFKVSKAGLRTSPRRAVSASAGSMGQQRLSMASSAAVTTQKRSRPGASASNAGDAQKRVRAAANSLMRIRNP